MESWGAAEPVSDTCRKPQVERPGTPPAPDLGMGTLGGLLTKRKQLMIHQHFAHMVVPKSVSEETWGVEVGWWRGRLGG